MFQNGNDRTPAIYLKHDCTVLMRLYPGTDLMVEISHPAALHLFALVGRYNVTIGKPGWASFWPRIKQIEREMTALFVEANGSWGQRFQMHYLLEEESYLLPQASDFIGVLESGRRKTLTEDVEKELHVLHGIHVAATTPKVCETPQDLCHQ